MMPAVLAALAILTSAAATLPAREPEPEVRLFVAADGDDANPGTLERPLRTLEAARDRARTQRQGDRATTIYLRGGTHVRTAGFTLADADSGTAAAPLRLRAWADERPVIRLARDVRLDAFSADLPDAVQRRLDPAARGNVRALDLGRLGATHVKPYPDLFVGSGGLLGVLFDGQRMPISRWPADGYTTMAEVLDSGIEPARGGTFRYRGDRPGRWTAALEHGGVWVAGFWRVPWVIQAVRVAAIDTDAKTITLAVPVPLGIGSKYTPLVNHTRRGDGREPWYVVNLLEELTRPGQWCIDFPTRTLYFWPPATNGDGVVSLLDHATPVLQIDGAQHVEVLGLTIEGGLAAGVQIARSQHVTIAGCTIRHTTGPGVVAEGVAIRIDSCDFLHNGAEAIRLTSGDRATLTPGQSQVLNNHVRLNGVISTASYAMEINGVGVRVAHNLIHDAPFGGVQYRGNDHLLELNEIHNIGLDGGDLGAFYTNGDLAGRGTVIRHNFVHHAANANAAYSDDGHSGDTIIANVVYRARCGPFIGGGHDHVVRDNLVIASQIGLHLDDRGIARGYGLENRNTALTRDLNRLPVSSPAWQARYPALASLLARPGDVPRPTGNDLSGNLLVGVATPTKFPTAEASRALNRLEPNTVLESSAFPPLPLDGPTLPPLPQPDALKDHPGIAGIPLQRIGLQVSQWRPTLPKADVIARTTPRPPRRLFDSETDLNAPQPVGH
jgi:hypothetical protein